MNNDSPGTLTAETIISQMISQPQFFRPTTLCSICNKEFTSMYGWGGPFTTNVVQSNKEQCPHCKALIGAPESLIQPPDFKFAELRTINQGYRLFKSSTFGLSAATTSFIGNLDRAVALGWFPWWLQRSVDTAVLEPMPLGAILGCHSIISSMLLGAWTALEVLAVDLWVESLNLRPKDLAIRAINGQPLRGADDDHSDGLGNLKKKDSGLKLIEAAINEHPEVAKEWGALVKLTNKYNFNRLSGICEAYKSTFSAKDGEGLFGAGFNDLHVLEGLRNLLVHRGGIVDTKFRTRVNGSRASYEKFGLTRFGLGQVVRLDGALVKSMIQSVSESAMKMVKFVDKWFADNPASEF